MNGLKTALLLGALTALLMLFGRVLGGNAGMMIGFVFAVVMNFGSYWFSDRIAMKMAGAREVTPAEAPELHRMVAEIAQKSGMPMPRVAVIESDAPNAFATGRNPKNGLVAATRGIMQVLDRRELRAVMAHEMGHIKNRDILIGSVAATIAGAISMLAQMAQWSMIFGGGRHSDDEGGGGLISALAMMILAPIAAMIIQLAITRSREFGADHTGAEVSGDPEALATALQKIEAYAKRIPMNVNPSAAHLFIVNPLSGASIRKLFSTHPPTEERVARLRAMSRGDLAGR